MTDLAELRAELRADCGRCAALCCVVPHLTRSADFAIDKPAGTPCPNLDPSLGCSIHATLRRDGFPGCAAFDCFGAGQRVVQLTFGGGDWRSDAGLRSCLFATYSTMLGLHELLWYLADAAERTLPVALAANVRAFLEETERLAGGTPHELGMVDVGAHRHGVDALLTQVSEVVRADDRGESLRRADLAGRDLRNADLRGADLRGSLLLGADLGGADLRRADVIGADLRGANLGGADLRDSLFLTRTQVGAARGDRLTRLPVSLALPAHWPH